jgi:hypothetical protein
MSLAGLVCTACEDKKLPTKVEMAEAENAQTAREQAEGRIPCALGGSDSFGTDCTVDRTTTQDGLFLTVRHPDGGFHRLIVTRDGRGVIAADGAQPAKVTIVAPDAIEVAIADARYRLPATVRGGKTQ